jgi:phage baseplate assembly protein W
MGNAYAKEDQGDLNVFNISTSRSSNYKDIDLTFKAKGTSGDIFKKENAAAVKQSIKTLLLTNRLEKPFNTDFGGDIQGRLFGLAIDNTASEIKDQVLYTIEKYEPRAEVLDLIVTLDPDRNSLHVNVEFKVINTGVIVEFSTVIERVR